MKDGRTHLAYKAEHAVDVVSEAIVATTVTFADKSDPQSAPATLSLAEANLALAGSETEIAEVVMDKGYHDNGWLADLTAHGIRTYIPERRQKTRRWTNKPAAYEAAFRANRRRDFQIQKYQRTITLAASADGHCLVQAVVQQATIG